MKSRVSYAASRFVEVGRGLAAVAVLAAVLPAACPAAARGESPAMTAVERAVLAADAGSGSLPENWKPVVRLLADVNEQTPDPVLRMLKGHACLAVNENNKSVCLFLSAQTPEAQERWLQWAEDFAKRYSHVPIAHYYHGDALARLGRWEDATAGLSTALDHAPNGEHALTFNARGVAHASRNDFRKARLDFHSAVASSGGRLADAYANIGALRIQMKDGAEGGESSYSLALKVSPQFALALHGRGCIRLILRRPRDAQADFHKAAENSGCEGVGTLMAYNALRVEAHLSGVDEKELLALIRDGEQSGMTLDSEIGHVQKTWDNFKKFDGIPWAGQHTFNRFGEALGTLPPQQRTDFLNNMVKPDLASDSALASNFQEGFADFAHTNKFVAPKVGGGMEMLGTGGTVVGGLMLKGALVTEGASLVPGAATTAAGIATNQLGKNMGRWGDIHTDTANTIQDTLGNFSVHGPMASLQNNRPFADAAPGIPGDDFSSSLGNIHLRPSSPAEFYKTWSEHTVGQSNFERTGTTENLLPQGTSRQSGGYDMSLANVGWERGDWPFLPCYGLSFRVDEDATAWGRKVNPKTSQSECPACGQEEADPDDSRTS